MSDSNVASSETSSDLRNDARWLFQSQDGSFNLYTEHKTNFESSPIQLEGLFAALSHMIEG